MGSPALGQQLPGQPPGPILGAVGLEIVPEVSPTLPPGAGAGPLLWLGRCRGPAHRPTPGGRDHQLGHGGSPAAPAHEQPQRRRGEQPQRPRPHPSTFRRYPGQGEQVLTRGQAAGVVWFAAAQPQPQALAATPAAQPQRIGQGVARESRGRFAAPQLQPLQVEVGEVEGEQKQAEHQKAQHQGPIALQLDRHHLQQADARQPEQPEAGGHDVEVAHSQLQRLALLGCSEVHRANRPQGAGFSEEAGCLPAGRGCKGRLQPASPGPGLVPH